MHIALDIYLKPKRTEKLLDDLFNNIHQANPSAILISNLIESPDLNFFYQQFIKVYCIMHHPDTCHPKAQVVQWNDIYKFRINSYGAIRYF